LIKSEKSEKKRKRGLVRRPAIVLRTSKIVIQARATGPAGTDFKPTDQPESTMMKRSISTTATTSIALATALGIFSALAARAEDWPAVSYSSRHQKLGFQESLPFLRVFAPSCETPVFRKRDAVEYISNIPPARP
jgi:hypothetical protein